MRNDQCYESGASKKSCEVNTVDKLRSLAKDPGTEGDTIRFLNGAIFLFMP
jgi:hypothetical protein